LILIDVGKLETSTNIIQTGLLFHFPSLHFAYDLQYTGMVAALTNISAKSKSVYFAHCTSEMIFTTHISAAK
jgi:hypothetical protein